MASTLVRPVHGFGSRIEEFIEFLHEFPLPFHLGPNSGVRRTTKRPNDLIKDCLRRTGIASRDVVSKKRLVSSVLCLTRIAQIVT